MKRSLLLLVVLSLLLSACDISITVNMTPPPEQVVEEQSVPPTSRPTSPPPSRPTPTEYVPPTDPPKIYSMYASSTNLSDIPFVLLHESGEKVGLIQGSEEGIVHTDSNGLSFVIYADNNGLPKTAIVGDKIILYSNYTGTTVDLTIIHSDGRRELVRATLKKDLLNKISALFPMSDSLVSYKLPGQERMKNPIDVDWGKVKTALYILGAGACVYAAYQSAGLITAALGEACVGPILETVERVGNLFNMNVGGLAELNEVLSAVGCINFSSALDCASFFASEMERQKETADQKAASIPPAPQQDKKKYP